jgi:hypothetical protein
MAERKVEIQISTPADTKGAVQAADAIDEVVERADAVDDALQPQPGNGLDAIPNQARPAAGSLAALQLQVQTLQTELSQLPVGSRQFETMAARVKSATRELNDAEVQTRKLAGSIGRRGNAGMAVLEFSRAFEDAQYGIRGVLNNIPGLIAMLGGSAGLAGAISIAAVAGTQLWERLIRGPKQAESETKGLLDTYEEIKKVFEGIETLRRGERDEASAAAANALAKTLGGIDRDVKLEVDANKVEAVRIEAEKRVQLAEKSLELARLEAGVLQTGGTDALRLAESRLRISEEIAGIERSANEAKRLLAISEAETKTIAAQRKEAEVKSAEFNAAQDVKSQQQDLEPILAKINELAERRLLFIADIESQLATKRAEFAKLGEGIPNEFTAALSNALAAEIKLLESRLPEAQKVPEDLAGLKAEADARQTSLDQSTTSLAELSKQTQTAAQALTDATLELKNLRETQGIEREAESLTDSARRERERIADAGGKESAAVDSLNGLLASVGDSGGKDLAPFVAELSSILRDRSLSADELARLPDLLAIYFGKVARLGEAQNQAVRDGISRIDELERAVKNLKANAGKPNP